MSHTATEIFRDAADNGYSLIEKGGDAALLAMVLAALHPSERERIAEMICPSMPGKVTQALAMIPRKKAAAYVMMHIGLEDPEKLAASAAIVTAWAATDQAGARDVALDTLGLQDQTPDDIDDVYVPGFAQRLRLLHKLYKAEVVVERGLEGISAVSGTLLEAFDPFLPGNQGGSDSDVTTVGKLVTKVLGLL